jgi:hypothetical protein
LIRREPSTIPEIRTSPELDGPDSEIRPLVALTAVPFVVLPDERLRELPLDARAGFLLSLVDGTSTVDMLLDISSLHEEETLAILINLMRLGAIELRR